MRQPTSQPAACTLNGAAFRIRESEFRDLFRTALRDLEHLDARSACLYLDSAREEETRELLARETRCCSFFEFTIDSTAEAVLVTARVPAGSEAALTFLLDLARASTTSTEAAPARIR